MCLKQGTAQEWIRFPGESAPFEGLRDRFRVWVLGFRVQGSGFEIQGLSVWDLGSMVYGGDLSFQDLGFRVWGQGLRV